MPKKRSVNKPIVVPVEKKPVVIQQTMFDIPAVSQVGNHRNKPDKAVRQIQQVNTWNIGLVAISEGRSENYKTFGDYIKSRT